MPTLLHISASPRGDQSISRRVSSAFAEAWRVRNPGGSVIERDLTTSAITFVDLDWIQGAFSPPEHHNEVHKRALAMSDLLISELLLADTVVIGTPMYNFAIPAVLKAWVDHVVRAGKTFQPNESGAGGLAGGRNMVVVIASGGSFEEGSAFAAFDQITPYLKQIFGFLGITDISFVRAGGAAALMQGEITEEEFLEPLLAVARSAA